MIIYKIVQKYEDIKSNVDNLYNNEIEKIIEDILKENEIYQLFFTILKKNYVQKFFIEKNSECFKSTYDKFIEKYIRNYEDFQDFKELIIIKTLSKGDKSYMISKLKKYIINPSQFFIGNKIKDNKTQIKIILKGYLIVILLHGTEYFLGTLNENKVASNKTPIKNEEGQLFLKYLFGIESISSISFEQAKRILNKENWNNPDEIKNIFKG